MSEKQEFRVVESLYPDFSEYADNTRFHFWMDYACELDNIIFYLHQGEDTVIEYINGKLLSKNAGSASHDACVDVASNLEESLSDQYKGKFTYE